MTVLCLLTIAQSIVGNLRATCVTRNDVLDMADAVENMKEVLAQIEVSPHEQDTLALKLFCQNCLAAVRGLLLDWDVSALDSLHFSTPKTMPHLEKKQVWKIRHPDRSRLRQEVVSCRQLLENRKDVFLGEPWTWLADFLTTLDFNLSMDA